MSHLFAISTYGSERARDANTGETVSAYKFGYSGAESAVMLALYGQRAQRVAAKRASYHYIALDKDAPKAVHGGYFLFDLTDDELARAEQITRRFPHDSSVYCYRWMNDAWHDMPTAKREYLPIASSYLAICRIKPGDHRAARLDESDASSPTENALILTQEGDWWWISGDTYPHRELLKRWGCRWGKRKQAWYYIGMNLPSPIQDLIDRLAAPVAPTMTPSDPPPTKSETEVIEKPPFQAGDRVRHRTFDTGIGKIIKLRNENGNPNSDGDWLYEVQFPDDDPHIYYATALTRVDPSEADAKTFDHNRPFYQLGANVYLTRSIYTQLEKPSIVGGTPVTIIARHDLRQWEGERKTDWGYQVRLADGQTHYVFDYQVSHRQSNDPLHKLPELQVQKYGSSDALRRDIMNWIAHRNRIGEQPNFDEAKPSATVTPTEAPAKSTSPQPQFTLGQKVWLAISLYLNADQPKEKLRNGTPGTIIARYDLNERYGNEAGWANHSRYGYRVQFEGQPESHLCFEDMLTAGRLDLDVYQRIQRMPIIPGYSATAMMKGVILDRQEISTYPLMDRPVETATPEKSTILTQQEQDDAVASLLAMAGMSEADEVTPTVIEPPKIVTTKPNLAADHPIAQAIERVGTVTLPPYQPPKIQSSAIRIPQ